VLHSSSEPGELSHWLNRDDSIMNIVVSITVSIIRPPGTTVPDGLVLPQMFFLLSVVVLISYGGDNLIYK